MYKLVNDKKSLRRDYFLLIVATLMLLFIPVFQSQAQDLPKVASTRLIVNFSELNKLWFQILNYLNNGDVDEANLKLQDLNRIKLKMGLDNLSSHTTVLVKKASEIKKQGNLRGAIQLVESARQLSPGADVVYFALGKLYFSQNFTDVYKVAKNIVHGLVLKYTDLNAIIIYANNGLFVLLLTGILTSTVFIVSSFMYYRRAIFYWLKEWLPGQFPETMGHLIGWVLIAVVTLGLGIYWGFLLLTCLLIWHVETVSKVILQCILFLGITLAAILIAIGVTYHSFHGEYLQVLRNISYGEFSSESAAILQKQLATDPDDIYTLFGLAYIAQQLGRDEEAIEAYSMMPPQYVDRAVVQNNLGNLYQKIFRANEKQKEWYEKAEEAYRNAIRSGPDMFEPHYNLGQLLLLDFEQSDSATSEIQKATNLDEDKYNLHSSNRIVTVDTTFSTRALMTRLYFPDFLSAGTNIAEQLWASGSRFKTPWYFSIASGVVFLLSLFTGTKSSAQKGGVVYCQMCGDPYTLIRRKKSKEPQTFCTQCTHIFKKKTVVKPEKRASKTKQIQLRQKIRGLLAKVSSLLFPGAGQIYFGYPLKGGLLALFFSLAAVILGLKGYFRVLLDTGGKTIFSWPTLVVLILILAGTYLINLRHIFNLSPKNQ